MNNETLIIGLVRAIAAMAAESHDITISAIHAGHDLWLHVNQTMQSHGWWSPWTATASWGATYMHRTEAMKAATAAELALAGLFAALFATDGEEAECGSSPRLDDTITLDVEGA